MGETPLELKASTGASYRLQPPNLSIKERIEFTRKQVVDPILALVRRGLPSAIESTRDKVDSAMILIARNLGTDVDASARLYDDMERIGTKAVRKATAMRTVVRDYLGDYDASRGRFRGGIRQRVEDVVSLSERISNEERVDYNRFQRTLNIAGIERDNLRNVEGVINNFGVGEITNLDFANGENWDTVAHRSRLFADLGIEHVNILWNLAHNYDLSTADGRRQFYQTARGQKFTSDDIKLTLGFITILRDDHNVDTRNFLTQDNVVDLDGEAVGEVHLFSRASDRLGLAQFLTTKKFIDGEVTAAFLNPASEARVDYDYANSDILYTPLRGVSGTGYTYLDSSRIRAYLEEAQNNPEITPETTGLSVQELENPFYSTLLLVKFATAYKEYYKNGTTLRIEAPDTKTAQINRIFDARDEVEIFRRIPYLAEATRAISTGDWERWREVQAEAGAIGEQEERKIRLAQLIATDWAKLNGVWTPNSCDDLRWWLTKHPTTALMAGATLELPGMRDFFDTVVGHRQTRRVEGRLTPLGREVTYIAPNTAALRGGTLVVLERDGEEPVPFSWRERGNWYNVLAPVMGEDGNVFAPTMMEVKTGGAQQWNRAGLVAAEDGYLRQEYGYARQGRAVDLLNYGDHEVSLDHRIWLEAMADKKFFLGNLDNPNDDFWTEEHWQNDFNGPRFDGSRADHVAAVLEHLNLIPEGSLQNVVADILAAGLPDNQWNQEIYERLVRPNIHLLFSPAEWGLAFDPTNENHLRQMYSRDRALDNDLALVRCRWGYDTVVAIRQQLSGLIPRDARTDRPRIAGNVEAISGSIEAINKILQEEFGYFGGNDEMKRVLLAPIYEFMHESITRGLYCQYLGISERQAVEIYGRDVVENLDELYEIVYNAIENGEAFGETENQDGLNKLFEVQSVLGGKQLWNIGVLTLEELTAGLTVEQKVNRRKLQLRRLSDLKIERKYTREYQAGLKLEQVKDAVDEEGKTKLFTTVLQLDNGELIGPDDPRFKEERWNAIGRIYEIASTLAELDMWWVAYLTSDFNPQIWKQINDAVDHGYKFRESSNLWREDQTIDNFSQALDNYRMLQRVRTEDWNLMDDDFDPDLSPQEIAQERLRRAYSIPPLLVGWAEMHLSNDERRFDLRAPTLEAQLVRDMLREILFVEEEIPGGARGVTRFATGADGRLLVDPRGFQLAYGMFHVMDTGGGELSADARQVGDFRSSATHSQFMDSFLRGILMSTFATGLRGEGAINGDNMQQRVGWLTDIMSQEKYQTIFERYLTGIDNYRNTGVPFEMPAVAEMRDPTVLLRRWALWFNRDPGYREFPANANNDEATRYLMRINHPELGVRFVIDPATNNINEAIADFMQEWLDHPTNPLPTDARTMRRALFFYFGVDLPGNYNRNEFLDLIRTTVPDGWEGYRGRVRADIDQRGLAGFRQKLDILGNGEQLLRTRIFESEFSTGNINDAITERMRAIVVRHPADFRRWRNTVFDRFGIRLAAPFINEAQFMAAIRAEIPTDWAAYRARARNNLREVTIFGNTNRVRRFMNRLASATYGRWRSRFFTTGISLNQIVFGSDFMARVNQNFLQRFMTIDAVEKQSLGLRPYIQRAGQDSLMGWKTQIFGSRFISKSERAQAVMEHRQKVFTGAFRQEQYEALTNHLMGGFRERPQDNIHEITYGLEYQTIPILRLPFGLLNIPAKILGTQVPEGFMNWLQDNLEPPRTTLVTGAIMGAVLGAQVLNPILWATLGVIGIPSAAGFSLGVALNRRLNNNLDLSPNRRLVNTVLSGLGGGLAASAGVVGAATATSYWAGLITTTLAGGALSLAAAPLAIGIPIIGGVLTLGFATKVMGYFVRRAMVDRGILEKLAKGPLASV